MIDYQTLCQAIEYWKQGGATSAGVAQEIVEEVDSGLVHADDIVEEEAAQDDEGVEASEDSVDSEDSAGDSEESVDAGYDSED